MEVKRGADSLTSLNHMNTTNHLESVLVYSAQQDACLHLAKPCATGMNCAH